jgi:hypothetical protein
MRFRVMAMVLGMAAGHAGGQIAQSNDAMASIAWLAGDWEAERPPATTATTKVAYHFHSILGGKALSIETTFNGNPRFDGLIAYDPARKTVALWYVTATGESTTGTMTPQDGAALFDLTVTSLEGKSTHLQVHIVHVDADHYRWEIYADPKGTGMSKLLETSYHRVK